MRGLIRKILKEELKTKKYKSLKPGVAELHGKKIVVILDENDRIVAHGPYITDTTDKRYICHIVEGLIEELFDEGEIQMEGLLKELDTRDFTNIQIIDFCNVMKESDEGFDWVNIEDSDNDEPIIDKDHRYDLIREVLNENKNYGDWYVSSDNMTGTIEWTNNNHGWTGLATPEWEKDFEIPVDIANVNDYHNITTITTPMFKTVGELKFWYKHIYYKTVSEILDKWVEENG